MSHVRNQAELEKNVSANGHSDASLYADGPNGGAQINGGNSLARQLSIQLTPEQFERLYLQPGGVGAPRQEDFIKRFGNPTILGLACFLLCLSPLSCYNMSFRGTNGATTPVLLVGTLLFTGGIGMWVAALLEWIVGNSFSFVVFGIFGSFYLSFGILNMPTYGLQAAFARDLPSLYNGLAIWLIFYGVLTFILFVCSLRTNVPNFMLFFCLMIQFFLTAAGYTKLAVGSHALGENLVKAGGAFQFATCMFGWYIFFAIMLLVNGAPFSLPLFDTSGWFAGKKARAGAHGGHAV